MAKECNHECDHTCPHAEESADRAVRKVFAILGVDVDKPESVEEFREDLRFGKKLRRAADHGFLAMVGVIGAAVLMAIWIGLQVKLGMPAK